MQWDITQLWRKKEISAIYRNMNEHHAKRNIQLEKDKYYIILLIWGRYLFHQSKK